VDAKFTVENELAHLYDDPRVTLRLGVDVRAVDVEAGRATGVVTRVGESEDVVRGELVVLGAGALFNATILQRSTLPHPLLGRRLHEQASLGATVDLAGLDNFQGSTKYSGHGYMLYDGQHRARHAACLIESDNMPTLLRSERGRERQLMRLKFIVEDLPQDGNLITLDKDGVAVLTFEAYSDYAMRGLDAVKAQLPSILAPLPVERIAFDTELAGTEGHMLGTVVMGREPATSVVDEWMVHHRVRNLAVLGGSGFATGSPANPTLTISALALRTAEHLMA
jgi:choline dehydrogenase-like flavoprotein